MGDEGGERGLDAIGIAFQGRAFARIFQGCVAPVGGAEIGVDIAAFVRVDLEREVKAEQDRADGARVALAANHLGLLYHDQGRLTEAESLYARALGIWEAWLGSEHEDVAAALNNLAEIAHAKGDWTAAEPLYERVLAIERKTLGAAHPDVVALFVKPQTLRQFEAATRNRFGSYPIS